MTNQPTDIICYAAGIGAHVAADTFPDRYCVAQTVDEAIALQKRHEHRYVFINADTGTRAELDAKHIKYVIVAPESNNRDVQSEWITRWLRSGSTAEDIAKRLARWDANSDLLSSIAPLAIIPPDKWVSQLLEQTPATAADGDDV